MKGFARFLRRNFIKNNDSNLDKKELKEKSKEIGIIFSVSQMIFAYGVLIREDKKMLFNSPNFRRYCHDNELIFKTLKMKNRDVSNFNEQGFIIFLDRLLRYYIGIFVYFLNSNQSNESKAMFNFYIRKLEEILEDIKNSRNEVELSCVYKRFLELNELSKKVNIKDRNIKKILKKYCPTLIGTGIGVLVFTACLRMGMFNNLETLPQASLKPEIVDVQKDSQQQIFEKVVEKSLGDNFGNKVAKQVNKQDLSSKILAKDVSYWNNYFKSMIKIEEDDDLQQIIIYFNDLNIKGLKRAELIVYDKLKNGDYENTKLGCKLSPKLVDWSEFIKYNNFLKIEVEYVLNGQDEISNILIYELDELRMAKYNQDEIDYYIEEVKSFNNFNFDDKIYFLQKLYLIYCSFSDNKILRNEFERKLSLMINQYVDSNYFTQDIVSRLNQCNDSVELTNLYVFITEDIYIKDFFDINAVENTHALLADQL